MDYNSMVVHIFMQPLREFYNLEDLWAEAPKIQIDTDQHTSSASTSPQESLADADDGPRANPS